MSVIHNIIYKKPLDVFKLDKFVSTIDGATFEKRGEDVLYFWIDEKSTRGFDITFEQGYIEVRNTILSNRQDYDLTNKVVAEILSLTEGVLTDEEGAQISNSPLFDKDRMLAMEIDDCESILFMSKVYEDIAIYGPIRMVHFGKRLHKKFKAYKGERLKDKMFDLVLNVNYKIPNFEYGNIIQIGDSDDDKKIMKLLTNKTDYIIDKYDYILLNKGKDEQLPIMITNEILNTMLPSNWTLVDEFTVVAPMTSEDEWKMLLKTAEKYDLTAEFIKNRNASH